MNWEGRSTLDLRGSGLRGLEVYGDFLSFDLLVPLILITLGPLRSHVLDELLDQRFF